MAINWPASKARATVPIEPRRYDNLFDALACLLFGLASTVGSWWLYRDFTWSLQSLI